MKRDCDACGRKYSAKSPRSKFCTDVECKRRRERERTRARRQARSSGGDVIALPVSAVVDEGTVAAATRVELEKVGRAATPAGRNALILAKRLDGASEDTGASVAALSKQHLVALAEAMKDAAENADEVDELGARRRRRHG